MSRNPMNNYDVKMAIKSKKLIDRIKEELMMDSKTSLVCTNDILDALTYIKIAMDNRIPAYAENLICPNCGIGSENKPIHCPICGQRLMYKNFKTEEEENKNDVCGSAEMRSDRKVIRKYQYMNFGFAKGEFAQFYCPTCRRQLGTLAYDKQLKKCPMCGQNLDWSEPFDEY